MGGEGYLVAKTTETLLLGKEEKVYNSILKKKFIGGWYAELVLPRIKKVNMKINVVFYPKCQFFIFHHVALFLHNYLSFFFKYAKNHARKGEEVRL